MERIIMLKEQEAKEIGVFLGKLEVEEKKQMVRGNEPCVNMELLSHYKKFLWR